jgi:hypothetical protein
MREFSIAVVIESDNDAYGGTGTDIMYAYETEYVGAMAYVAELRAGASSVNALSADVFVRVDGATRLLAHFDFRDADSDRIF